MQRCSDLFFAFFFLPFTTIAVAIIYVLYKIFVRTDGPFFYRGERLGKNKRIFIIYKIRTLAENAETLVGGSILAPNSGIELKYGRFLRNTRLDELPQFFNIIKGDMTFFGPRPVREAVYEELRDTVRNYDDRFLVKPGLAGYSQVLTPHSTSPRIRSLVDNHFLHEKQHLTFHIVFVLYTIISLLRNFCVEASAGSMERIAILRFWWKRANLRRMRRKPVKGVEFELLESGDCPEVSVVDINFEALAIETSARLEIGQVIGFVLKCELPQRNTRKRAVCKGTVYRKIPASNPAGRQSKYILFYEPKSHVHRFIIDRYVLQLSIGVLKWQQSPCDFFFMFMPRKSRHFGPGRGKMSDSRIGKE